MSNGWICLHRSFLDWEWFGDEKMIKVFLYCLLKANHKDGSWQGIEVKKGSFITGRKKLAEETGLSEKSIRTALNKLKSTGELAIQSTNRYSVITLVNWGFYQGEEEIGASKTASKTANKGPTKGQQRATNNNDNNDNNENKFVERARAPAHANGELFDSGQPKTTAKKPTKRFVPPTIDELHNFMIEKGQPDRNEAVLIHSYYGSKGWKVGKTPMINWKLAVVHWLARDQKTMNQRR